MKIALVTASFLPRVGGAEFTVHNLALQWHAQGHEICIMNCVTNEVTHAQGKYMVKQFKLLRGSTRFGYHCFPMGWYAQRGLGRLLNEFKPDFISAHFGYPTGYWLSRIKPLPKYLVTCHGSEITKSEWSYRQRYNCEKQLAHGLKKSAGCVAISTYARKLMEELMVESSHIFDIPNGVDLERFQSKVDFDLRSRFRIPKEAVVILSVGRDHPAKAYDTAIKAFAKLNSKVNEVFYVMLGNGIEKWRSLASELGIGKQMGICEGLYGNELVGAYQQADIFFSSSVQEMFPLVAIEAMTAGLAEVVTNVGGSQDVIKNGLNGFVAEPNQPDEMADALYKLATDETLRKRMGDMNRERSKFYGWDHISRLYLEHV
jgi:glycosyltransferase involved in cell wall biosynthesis